MTLRQYDSLFCESHKNSGKTNKTWETKKKQKQKITYRFSLALSLHEVVFSTSSLRMSSKLRLTQFCLHKWFGAFSAIESCENLLILRFSCDLMVRNASKQRRPSVAAPKALNNYSFHVPSGPNMTMNCQNNAQATFCKNSIDGERLSIVLGGVLFWSPYLCEIRKDSSAQLGSASKAPNNFQLFWQNHTLCQIILTKQMAWS